MDCTSEPSDDTAKLEYVRRLMLFRLKRAEHAFEPRLQVDYNKACREGDSFPDRSSLHPLDSVLRKDIIAAVQKFARKTKTAGLKSKYEEIIQNLLWKISTYFAVLYHWGLRRIYPTKDGADGKCKNGQSETAKLQQRHEGLLGQLFRWDCTLWDGTPQPFCRKMGFNTTLSPSRQSKVNIHSWFKTGQHIHNLSSLTIAKMW